MKFQGHLKKVKLQLQDHLKEAKLQFQDHLKKADEVELQLQVHLKKADEALNEANRQKASLISIIKTMINLLARCTIAFQIRRL